MVTKALLSACLLFGLVNAGLCCLPFGAIANKVKSIVIPEVKIAKIVTHGCYIAREPKENEDTTGTITTLEGITWQKCRDQCFGNKRPADKAKIGMKLQTCWCNFEYVKADQTDDAKCDQKCVGDDREPCGGSDYVSVFLPHLDANG